MIKTEGKSVDMAKSQKVFLDAQETAWWERVGKATEAFNAMHQSYATDYHLAPEEVAAAVYLENLNMREFYPAELGGIKGYDDMCKAVWTWFEQQKKKGD
jgi:hypothetical protein